MEPTICEPTQVRNLPQTAMPGRGHQRLVRHWCRRLTSLLGGALLATTVRGGQAAEPQVISGPIAQTWTNSTPLAGGPRGSLLNLAIGLPLRTAGQLHQLLAELYDPASPRFRQYLTPAEFTERFGPSEADYQSLIRFAQSQGLIVTGQHPNRMVLDVRGAVPQVERAFHVHLNTYQHPREARTFFAPDATPTVQLATPVLSVSGLDNFTVPRPAGHWKLPSRGVAQATGSGPGGDFIGYDFRHAYAPDVALTGVGQKVGLFELDGFYASDVAAYKTLAGLPDVPVTTILADSFNGRPGADNIEVSLDIDMAIAMAPGLSAVLVYEGNQPNTVLNRMATDAQAKQISASWTYPIDATSIQIFQQYAAQGQSFFNASGDSGAYAPGTVSPPTDVPYITVVGGTDLTTQPNGGAWVGETTWPLSSGGISTTYAIPAWQQGIDMSLNQGSTAFRNLPDVAMIADHCYLIADNGTPYSVQGTSIAAPLWAAFTALVNQFAVTNNQPAVGFINPAIYAMGKGSNGLSYNALFHDINTGNNRNTGSPSRFSAVNGYDLCTGWGVPTGSNLIMALALPEPLRITPGGSSIISGPAGGPFAPAAPVFALTNTGVAPLAWSLVNTSAWFNLSLDHGTVTAGGGNALVTATLTPLAATLPPGSYPATIVFKNLNDNVSQTRLFTLAVITPPVITTQPTNQYLLVGMTANFTVGTAPNALLYYQWRSNGINMIDGGRISGSQTSTLSLTGVTGADTNRYSVVVSNSTGTAISSDAGVVIVPSAPLITLQPVSQTVLPGQTVTFSVAAVGDTPYTYHWQLNGVNLANGVKYAGATTSTLTVSNAFIPGTFSVNVSNARGTTSSTGAVLTLIPVSVPGVNLSTPFSFAGGASAANPYSPLAIGKNGNYYGTSYLGGPTDDGTLYRFNTNGTITVLSALNYVNGSAPYAGLTLGKDGNYYGVTAAGGSFSNGVALRLSTANVQTTLAQFNGQNGQLPAAALVQGTDGIFYGTANGGGAYNYGTVFRMTTSGTISTLASFNYTDGSAPSPVLIQATDGNLYGTTEDGGTNGGYGTVFRISATGQLTTLHSFNNSTDGGVPIAGVVQAADGNFYGVAIQGGTHGYGTVYEITADGVFTTLYAFSNSTDGGSPWGGLMVANDGNLYGTTQAGGKYGFGTVFRLAPNGPVTTVAQFDGYNGANPSAAFLQGPDGNLYGTTLQGGANGLGSVTRLNFTGPLQITGQPSDQLAYVGGSASFTVAVAGAAPAHYQWQQNGIDLTDDANISGATTATLRISNITVNASALYSVVVTNAFNSVTSDDAVLAVTVAPPRITSQPLSQTRVAGASVTFSVGVAGEQPLSYQWQQGGTTLTDGGNITGAATSTLTITNLGLANAGTYTLVVSNALAVRVSAAATLTVLPAATPGAGFTSLRQLNGGTDGAYPYAGLTQGRDGNLYGVAIEGGALFAGTAFRVNPGAGSYTTLASFAGANSGANPYGRLVQGTNGNFYGSTFNGGADGYGTEFRLSGSALVYLLSFTGDTDGGNPYDGLILGQDGQFYGTTPGGGNYSAGVAFVMNSAGVTTPLYEFQGNTDGAFPYAGLVQDGTGLLYGTTLQGGGSDVGTVYSLNLNGTLTTLHSFNSTDGAYPQAGLTIGLDGNLYGTTVLGGAGGQGAVFRLTPGGDFTNLVTFYGTNGAEPAAALIQGTDGNFYGTTSAGGPGGLGTVFRMTPAGGLTTLFSFNGFNGANPQGTLVQATDGSFYGTAPYGGVAFNPSAGGGYGVVFRLTVPLFTNSSLATLPAISGLPYAADLAGKFTAAAGDVVSFAKVSGPAWLLVGANGSLSGIPGNADLGTNSFTVSVVDTNGLSATASLTIVVNANPPPMFLANPFSLPAALADTVYSGSIATNATDGQLALGDSLTFSKLSGPGWLQVATNGLVSGTPLSADAGTNVFTVGVSDLGGSLVTASLNIVVKAGPHFSPVSFTRPDATVGLAYAGSLSNNAVDPGLPAGTSLTFAKISGPAWLSVTADGGYSGTPGSGDVGSGLFVVQVSDAGGLTGTGSMTINVSTDHPPVFATNLLIGLPAVAGQTYVGDIGASVSDPDFGDAITLAKTAGPAWLGVSASGALSGNPGLGDVGTNSFSVTATDLLGQSSATTLQILVAGPVNTPLVLQVLRADPFVQLLWTGGVPPYQVQTTTDLGGAPWANLGGLNAGTSLLVSPTNAAAFYRVIGQ